MKTIRISEAVWQAIASRGRFGETPDDVLRRVFNLEPRQNHLRRCQARRRLTTRVEHGTLTVAFANGPVETWRLPNPDDKRRLRQVRDEALAFAEVQGATEGQIKGLLRVLTGAGYHLTK